MKKIAILLALTLLLCASSCGASVETADPTDAQTIVGGWQTPDSPAVTPQLRAVWDKAFETFTGAQYEPVAYLASQVVAGMNHRLLCKTNSVFPDGTQTYSIVELYEDLQGNVRITDIVDSATPTNLRDGENLSGGWTQPDDPAVPDDLRDALQSAGSQNVPVACLATQLVAGRNYCLLCQAPDADPPYTFVYLYVDLQGNAQITDAVLFTEGSDNASR